MILPSEQEEQIALHEWCKIKGLLSWATPNGGSRNAKEAMNMKKEGVTAGVADYIVMLPDKIIFIEMKRRARKLKSGLLSISHTKVSEEQKRFLERVSKFKYAEAYVCYGAKDAIFLLKSLL